MVWEELSHPWQCCLEEAWAAYCAGSDPIGAVVTDSAGRVLSRGRNRRRDRAAESPYLYNSPIAHAEVNALIALDYKVNDPPHACVLFTTTEPCPMCLGAFYMSGVRELRYASHDPFAGSADLLGKTPYMARKPIKVTGPERPDLETIIVALHAEMRLGERGVGDAVVEMWNEAMPDPTRLGEALLASGELRRMRDAGATAAGVVEAIAVRGRTLNVTGLAL